MAKSLKNLRNLFKPLEQVSQPPGAPIQPSDLKDWNRPRTWGYPVGYNTFGYPNTGRGIDFSTLRELSSSWAVLRRCIEIRKQEMASLKWAVVPAIKEAGAEQKLKKRIRRTEDFFKSPDGLHTTDTWLKMLLEDLFVTDTFCLYKRIEGGKLVALEPIDGTTIKPLIDEYGRIPRPPLPSYQQIIYGRPTGLFTLDELTYNPYNVRTNSLYGFSNVEQIILIINIALRRELWHLAYFTDGNIPEMFCTAPPDWTAEQIEQFQAYWDALMTGDPAQQRRVKWVPGESSPHLIKQGNYDSLFDEYLVKMACVGMDVQPTEIGFQLGSSLGGKGAAEQQETITYRKSLRPLVSWFEQLVNRYIIQPSPPYGLGEPDLNLQLMGLEVQDEFQKERTNKIIFEMGGKSINEARKERGQLTLDSENADKHYILLGNNMYCVEDGTIITNRAILVDPYAGGAKPTDEERTELIVKPGAKVPVENTPEKGNTPEKKELEKWSSMAIQRFRKGKPQRRFESDILKADLCDSIYEQVSKADSLEDIKAVFKTVKVTTSKKKLRQLTMPPLIFS